MLYFSMSFIADLHIHSRYSRATSRDMCLEEIHRWAQLKGIKVIGTGDLTHPAWYSELREKLILSQNGMYELREALRRPVPDPCSSEVFFIPSAEISCIYSRNGRIRKIHLIIYLPDLDDAAKLNKELSKIGNLGADGRPILGLDAKELLQIVLNISPDGVVVPAHAWTPHFSIFGSESGFDSLEECFEDLTPYIYAIETGLSSDPPMNWRLSSLDRITLISNSDAHSPSKIGREANIINSDMTYSSIMDAIKRREGFVGTIEFFPEEGKYHYDGHRSCGVSLSPSESGRHNNICPVCGRRLTIGVMNRVSRLADRPEGFVPPGAPLFRSIIPLTEIISEVSKKGPGTKHVEREYLNLLSNLGSEFHILLESPLEEIEKVSSPLLREAIERVRDGRVNISPGYDGVYGKIRIFEETGQEPQKGQGILF